MILRNLFEPKGVVAFKVMGHEKVWVLDGGLPAWIKEGYATEKTGTIV
jgi:thiosulfate/3-mercaptopyruvate sulfurtransferase